MRAALATIALVFTTSCEEPAPEIRISSLELAMAGAVTDVEVHVFDAATGDHLGCSGTRDGLQAVVEGGVRYELDAVVRLLHLDEPLRHDDVQNRQIVFEVWQNGGPACPAAPSVAAGDVAIGASDPISGETYDEMPLVFDGVAHLQLFQR